VRAVSGASARDRIPGGGVAPAERFPDARELGSSFPRYRHVHPFVGDFVDAEHRSLSELPIDDGLIRGAVPGYLRPADALVLYELAYFTIGDVLELGSAWGLSTAILCAAVKNSGREQRVLSIELEPTFRRATRRAIRTAGLRHHHRLVVGEAGQVVDDLIARHADFGLVFVDHDHAYESTVRVCRQLGAVLQVGGIAVFHDLNDERNVSEPEQYGVHRAVAELLQRPGYAFLGVIGCCGIVQRTAA
jgi:predicted O-methyltransferase YrrM